MIELLIKHPEIMVGIVIIFIVGIISISLLIYNCVNRLCIRDERIEKNETWRILK